MTASVEHRVAGPGQRGQRRQQAVLRARGDDDLVDRWPARRAGPPTAPSPVDGARAPVCGWYSSSDVSRVGIDRRGGGDRARRRTASRAAGSASGRRCRRRRVRGAACTKVPRPTVADTRPRRRALAVGARDGRQSSCRGARPAHAASAAACRGDAAGGDVGGQGVDDAQVERPRPAAAAPRAGTETGGAFCRMTSRGPHLSSCNVRLT